MAVYTRDDSPFFWMLLEGTGRKKESTGIPRHATDPDQRKRNRLEAENIYHARMIQLARQRVGLPVESARTFAEHADWYLQHVVPTHDGSDTEAYLVGQLRRHFGTTRLSDITPGLIAEYDGKRLKAGRKLNTVNREVRFLQTMLNGAVGTHLEVSPLARLRRKRVRLKPKRTVEAREEPALLAALLAIDPELHDMYVVGVGTLLRQGNLVKMLRSQHRGDRLVADTKTGPHTVWLNGPTELQTRAAAVLKARWPTGARDPFFAHWFATFKRLKPATARYTLIRKFRAAVTKAGLPWGLDHDGLVWHTATRATGATRLMRDYQIDIRTVQQMGPWASLDQMAEYLGYVAPTGTAHR